MAVLPAAILGIGMNELMILIVLALVVIGPKRLPEVARGIGKLMAQFRRATSDLREVVSTEINTQPGLKELKDIHKDLRGDMQGLKDRARDYMNREFDKEQSALDSVERDLHGVANDVGATVRQAGQEAEETAQGTASAYVTRGEASTAKPAADGTMEPTPGREPWNVQMNKLFFRDKIDKGEMSPEGRPPSAPESESRTDQGLAATHSKAGLVAQQETAAEVSREPSSGAEQSASASSQSTQPASAQSQPQPTQSDSARQT